MEEQYKWLEELIMLADKGEQTFEPKCEGVLQESKELSEKWKEYGSFPPTPTTVGADIRCSTIKEMCKKHKDLRADTTINGINGDKYWDEAVNGQTDSVTWGFNFKTNPADKSKTCSFTCEEIFNAFVESKDCKFAVAIVSGIKC